MGLMKQAAQLQSKMQELQAELDTIEVEGSAGGGMVRVMFNGLQEAVDVKIDPQVLKDEGPEFVQEMVLAAVRQGLAKSKELGDAERAKVTGKLGLPGLEGMI